MRKADRDLLMTTLGSLSARLGKDDIDVISLDNIVKHIQREEQMRNEYTVKYITEKRKTNKKYCQ